MFDCAKRDVFKIKSFSGSLADLINNNNDCNGLVPICINKTTTQRQLMVSNTISYYGHAGKSERDNTTEQSE